MSEVVFTFYAEGYKTDVKFQAENLVDEVKNLVAIAKKNSWSYTWTDFDKERHPERTVENKPEGGWGFESASERMERNLQERDSVEFCPHDAGWTKKISHTTQNPGREFKACKKCGKFLGWI